MRRLESISNNVWFTFWIDESLPVIHMTSHNVQEFVGDGLGVQDYNMDRLLLLKIRSAY